VPVILHKNLPQRQLRIDKFIHHFEVIDRNGDHRYQHHRKKECADVFFNDVPVEYLHRCFLEPLADFADHLIFPGIKRTFGYLSSALVHEPQKKTQILDGSQLTRQQFFHFK